MRSIQDVGIFRRTVQAARGLMFSGGHGCVQHVFSLRLFQIAGNTEKIADATYICGNIFNSRKRQQNTQTPGLDRGGYPGVRIAKGAAENNRSVDTPRQES